MLCMFLFKRAANETRTRDPDLGKVVLYQLSYFRLYGEPSPLPLLQPQRYYIFLTVQLTKSKA